MGAEQTHVMPLKQVKHAMGVARGRCYLSTEPVLVMMGGTEHYITGQRGGGRSGELEHTDRMETK